MNRAHETTVPSEAAERGRRHEHGAGGGADAGLPASLSAVVLLVWAALFWMLFLTGDWSRFIAARVMWIVPVAAALLTVAGLAIIVLAGAERPRPVGRRELVRAACLILPALIVAAVPLNTLSTYAAERRSAFAGAASWVTPELSDSDPLTFQHLIAAQGSETMSAALRERQGESVELLGMVTDVRGGEFTLTRFVVACCVVDAAVVNIEVHGDRSPGEVDSWVRVTGALGFDEEGTPVLEEAVAEPAEEPNPPYLYPGS